METPMDTITVTADKYFDSTSGITYLDFKSHSKLKGISWINRISLELLSDLEAIHGNEFNKKLTSILMSRSSFFLRFAPSTESELMFFNSFIAPIGDEKIISLITKTIHNDVKLISRMN